MWRGTGMLILEFAVALINHTAVLAVGVPDLCTKVTAAVAADNLTCVGTGTAVLLAAL